MKNYYRILQVDPEAEQEVIDAAYKRLMKKYHPDMLTPEQKVDRSLLEKVQEINEAYKVLSNIKLRQEYDTLLKESEKIAQANSQPGVRIKVTIEKRIYTVKCAISRKTYRMLLARKQGTQEKFKILGFEPVETVSPPEKGSNWLVMVSKKYLDRPVKKIDSRSKKGFMPDEEIEDLFSDENAVSIADVDWTGQHNCPDCGSEVVKPDSVAVHWLRCGSCSHLYCVGNAESSHPNGFFSKCPWCNKTNVIEWKSSKPKEQLVIGGREYEKTEYLGQKSLPEKKQKALRDGK